MCDGALVLRDVPRLPLRSSAATRSLRFVGLAEGAALRFVFLPVAPRPNIYGRCRKGLLPRVCRYVYNRLWAVVRAALSFKNFILLPSTTFEQLWPTIEEQCSGGNMYGRLTGTAGHRAGVAEFALGKQGV